MSYRNFLQMTSQVYRDLEDFKEKPELYEVQQALNDALLEICQYHNWNFLIDRFDIPTAPTYNTGTAVFTQGSTTVTGNGTAWSTSWYNRKILATASSEKQIDHFDSATQLTLRYPWAPTSLTSSYTIYKDEFPVICQSGRDIMMIDPLRMRRLRKVDRYTLEDRTTWGRFFLGPSPTHYSDAGADSSLTSPSYNRTLLKVWPPPGFSQDLILIFYKTPTVMINDTDTTVLPNEFEEVLIRLAEYRIRKSIGSPGWMEDHQFASRMLLQFREKQSIQPSYDYMVEFSSYPFADPYSTDMSIGSWPGRIG